jgi:predicted metalloprotease with PDZ domain
MVTKRSIYRSTVFFSALLTLSGYALAQSSKTPIQVTADLSEASRKLFHAEYDFPVTAGPLTLTGAKWIPGTHGPNGPIDNITGIVFTANGQTLPWRRDDVDLYQFHVTIPKGVTTLHAHIDALIAGRVSQHLAVLEWEELLLYPANTPVAGIPIQPSVIVPAGWGIGTALTPLDAASYPTPSAGAVTHFAAINVEQLEDTPILTGQYFHEFALAPEISPKHYIDVASDAPEDSNLRPGLLNGLSNLVREADALYRSHHYNQYHFLLTLSDVTGGGGLEHGQSSDNGAGEKTFSDEGHQLATTGLLPHEFSHSWNGKYRRPVGLYQPDFATPEQGALLWVYEGMTRYLGNMVLTTRSKLRTQAQFRDYIALSAATLDNQSGREWRPTVDTAVGTSLLRGGGAGGSGWANWRRGSDYYQEGELLWLDVDTLIRTQTNDRKSLDDFERIFVGKGGNTGPLIVPYTFDELVQDLNEVTPYDWAKFLHDRVDTINPRADVAGIERAGYKLVYTDRPNESERILSANAGRRVGRGAGGSGGVEVWYSIGLRVDGEGSIGDVRWGGPADKARLSPGQKILAINGQVFSGPLLRTAIRDAKGKSDPIHLILESQDVISTADIDYHDGERYPSLVRIEGTPDLLEEITKPLAPSPVKSGVQQ